MGFLRAGLQMSFTVALNCIMSFWSALLMRTWFLWLPRKHHKVFPASLLMSVLGWPRTPIKKKKRREKEKAVTLPVVFQTSSGPTHLPQPLGRSPGCGSVFTQWPIDEITPLCNSQTCITSPPLYSEITDGLVGTSFSVCHSSHIRICSIFLFQMSSVCKIYNRITSLTSSTVCVGIQSNIPYKLEHFSYILWLNKVPCIILNL